MLGAMRVYNRDGEPLRFPLVECMVGLCCFVSSDDMFFNSTH